MAKSFPNEKIQNQCNDITWPRVVFSGLPEKNRKNRRKFLQEACFSPVLSTTSALNSIINGFRQSLWWPKQAQTFLVLPPISRMPPQPCMRCGFYNWYTDDKKLPSYFYCVEGNHPLTWKLITPLVNNFWIPSPQISSLPRDSSPEIPRMCLPLVLQFGIQQHVVKKNSN